MGEIDSSTIYSSRPGCSVCEQCPRFGHSAGVGQSVL